jgi:hypothetical protein
MLELNSSLLTGKDNARAIPARSNVSVRDGSRGTGIS